MKESSGYQLMLAEGRVEEAKRLLFLLGEDRFGKPDSATKTAIDNISDVQQLETLNKRLMKTSNWQELLGQPAPRPRSRRKK